MLNIYDLCASTYKNVQQKSDNILLTP